MMGGTGSGSWYRWHKRDTVEDCQSIDIRRWQQDGLLTEGYYFSWTWTRNGEQIAAIGVRVEYGRVVLNYQYRRYGGDWQEVEYPAYLTSTPCHYGGSRPWLLCPAQGCGRRVAKLYLGGRVFACRYCYHLAYPSQSENAAFRSITRAQKIRVKLGGSADLSSPFPEKPKGMHWRTYERLRNEAEQAEWQSVLALGRWLQRLRKAG
jgi:hypothetical protein